MKDFVVLSLIISVFAVCFGVTALFKKGETKPPPENDQEKK